MFWSSLPLATAIADEMVLRPRLEIQRTTLGAPVSPRSMGENLSGDLLLPCRLLPDWCCSCGELNSSG